MINKSKLPITENPIYDPINIMNNIDNGCYENYLPTSNNGWLKAEQKHIVN